MITYNADLRERLMVELRHTNPITFESQRVTSSRDTFYKIMNNMSKVNPRLVRIEENPDNRRRKIYKITLDGSQYAGYVIQIKETENEQSKIIPRTD